MSLIRVARAAGTVAMLVVLGQVLSMQSALLAQQQPVLQVSPTSLSFQGQLGGPAPDPQPLTISNAGGGLLEWQASTDVGWIVLGGTEGKLSGGRSIHLQVFVAPEGLAAGEYQGTITIEAPRAQGSPAQVKVSLKLTSSPRLEVSPSSLSFQAEEGGANPEPQTLTVKNRGASILSWEAKADAGWLRLGAYGGSLVAGQSSEVLVLADISGLSVGSHGGRITITAPEAQGSPAVVTVSLEIRPRTSAQPQGMVLIPAGSFQMGDSFSEGDSDELPVHTVFVSAFYMDKYEVTKALWDEVASWAAAHGYDIGPADGSGKAADHPVFDVTWYEAVKWANARSEKEGLTPCYRVGENIYRRGESRPDCNWRAKGYRLPTEAEWEKAARGGCSGHRFPWCDTDTIQHTRANYHSSSDYSYDTSLTRGYHPDYDNDPQPYTSPVGSFAPNGYGLYDMAGNVWEWIWDWYDPNCYEVSPGSDPRGPSLGSSRMVRGGGWFHIAGGCRAANRGGYGPDGCSDYIGFRAVLPPGQ